MNDRIIKMTPELQLAFEEYKRIKAIHGDDAFLTGITYMLVMELAPVELRLEIARQSIDKNSSVDATKYHSDGDLMKYFYDNNMPIGLTPDAVAQVLSDILKRRSTAGLPTFGVVAANEVNHA